MRLDARRIALALLAAFPTAGHTLDSLPLDQLRQGLWKVERRIERIAGGDPAHVGETHTRVSEYCVDPKQEILRTLRAASFLCKTEITRRDDSHYEVAARCALPGISGESRTLLTLTSPTRYRAEVETKGRKFGDFQHRREKIDAVRTGDCKAS